jgi:hypothetical protein
VFPAEERMLERATMIAAIIAAQRQDAEAWSRAISGVKVLQRD